MRRLLVSVVAASIGLAGWAPIAGAQAFSSKAPVIAILDGKLLVGEAIGHLGGWGTIALRSRSIAGLTCVGEFSYSEALGDVGELNCSDGARAAFGFRRLSLMRGYGDGGAGASGLGFTYGLSAEDSARYLKLPPGKELRHDGHQLVIASSFKALSPP